MQNAWIFLLKKKKIKRERRDEKRNNDFIRLQVY